MAYQATAEGRGAGERFGSPGEYVGFEVHDPRGRRIGRAKALFVNAHAEPEYIRIKMGLLGLRSALIPVQDVAVDEGRRVLTLR